MKNIILTLVTVVSLIGCQKNESVTAGNTGSSITVDSASDRGDSLHAPVMNRIDSASTGIKDTAVVKVQDIREQKKLLTEKVAKEIDSATKATIIAEIKITQKIDSVNRAVASNRKKDKIHPNIVKETKIIYRETPKQKAAENKPGITKKGELEILVNDFETARMTTKENIYKYDGVVKSEQISSNESKQFDYLKISLPLDKSDFFIRDLEDNVGKITYRNIEISGEEHGGKNFCYLELTLINNLDQAAVAAKPHSFGGRTLDAVGAGWNVIEEIFLFVLPFWPLFLIGGGIYYFFKRKKISQAE